MQRHAHLYPSVSVFAGDVLHRSEKVFPVGRRQGLDGRLRQLVLGTRLRELQAVLNSPEMQRLRAIEKSAQAVLDWTDAKHRPPVREAISAGESAEVRVHALADLHDALRPDSPASVDILDVQHWDGGFLDLSILERKGYIEVLSGTARSIRIKRLPGPAEP